VAIKKQLQPHETSHPDESGHTRMIIGEFHLAIKKQIKNR